MALHRKPKDRLGGATRRSLPAVAVVGTVGAGASLVGAAGAPTAAASSTVWDRLAQCESSGNFVNQDTGHNGHYGGFQFSPATWKSVGGLGSPASATPAEQLKRAKILLARSGPGQWECKVGLTKVNGARETLTVLRSAPTPTRSTVRAAMTVSPLARLGASARVAVFARAQIGKPYVFGAAGPHSFDCSGLTSAAWRTVGVDIPRTSEQQLARLARVPASQVQPGDIVTYLGGHHVAVYVGGGKIVEAPRPGKLVRLAPFRTGWYADHFTAVLRPVGVARTTAPQVTRPVTGAKTYKVRAGDTLDGIATAHHVRGGWPALYRINRGAVGASPHLIHAGLLLRLG